jgi:hypothetical protein
VAGRKEAFVIVGRSDWRLELWKADVEARALVGDDAASRVEGLWRRCMLAGYC